VPSSSCFARVGLYFLFYGLGSGNLVDVVVRVRWPRRSGLTAGFPFRSMGDLFDFVCDRYRSIFSSLAVLILADGVGLQPQLLLDNR